jgi:ribosomal protein S18 acetylase RimI-like enzyme
MLRIRRFRPEDTDALYAISLATGSAGSDASHLYEDPKLMGQIYSAAYALLEPELALVVEDREGVAGFAVGAIDTAAWEARLEREWWPPLRRRYAAPPEADKDSWTADQRRAFTIHHPSQAPSIVVWKYPAHLHLNLLPRLQGRGVGAKLFDGWRLLATARGATAIHVAVNHANARAVHFWRKLAFAELGPAGLPHGRTVWMGRE